MLDKIEIGRGHLGGPVEYSEGKCGESAVPILRFLCGSPCLCQLRTEGLVPVSKYWTYQSHAGVYGPSKPSSLSTIETWLNSTALLVGLGEKLGMDPWISQPRVLWIMSEALFSREQWDPSKFVDDSWKVATYGDCPQEAYAGYTWTGVGSVCVVLIRFSPVGCTSIRITVTLRYK
jgi:hypothetical protein